MLWVVVIGASCAISLMLFWGLPALSEYLYWRPSAEHKRVRRSMERDVRQVRSMFREARSQMEKGKRGSIHEWF